MKCPPDLMWRRIAQELDHIQRFATIPEATAHVR